MKKVIREEPDWKEKGLYFIHLRLNDQDEVVYPFGGITFCYEHVKHGTGQKIKYAIAVTSIMDIYNKRIGRLISSGRLTAKHFNCLEKELRFANGFSCPMGGELYLEKEEMDNVVKHLQEIGKFLITNIFLDDDEDDEDEEFSPVEDTSVH